MWPKSFLFGKMGPTKRAVWKAGLVWADLQRRQTARAAQAWKPAGCEHSAATPLPAGGQKMDHWHRKRLRWLELGMTAAQEIDFKAILLITHQISQPFHLRLSNEAQTFPILTSRVSTVSPVYCNRQCLHRLKRVQGDSTGNLLTSFWHLGDPVLMTFLRQTISLWAPPNHNVLEIVLRF